MIELLQLCHVWITISLTCLSLWWVWQAIGNVSQHEPVMPRRFRSSQVYVPRYAVAVTIAWLLLPFFLSSSEVAVEEFDPVRWSQAVKIICLESAIIWGGLLAIVFISVGHPVKLAKLGFRTDDVLTQFQNGAYGFELAFVPVYATMVLTSSFQSEETIHPLLRLIEANGMSTDLLWIILSAVILAPLKEELMFRVILQSWLTQKLGVWWGILIASIIFASVHGFPNGLGIFPLAIVLGIVYHQRRSYLAVVVLHALFNAYNVFAALITVIDTP